MKVLKLYLLLPFFILAFSACKKIPNLKTEGKPFTGEWMTIESSLSSVGLAPNFVTITNDSLIMELNSYTLRLKYNLSGNTISFRNNADDISLKYEMVDDNLFLISDYGDKMKLNKYGSSAGFDFVGFIAVFIFGIAGLILLIPSTINYYYAFGTGSWKNIKAKITSVDVITGKYSRYTDHTYTTYGLGPGAEVTESSQLFNYTKITKTSTKPLINFVYEVDGKTYKGNSAEVYNHKGTYSVSAARQLMDDCKATGLTIKVNPKNAKDIYLGAKHFPWILNFVFFVLGVFLSIGISEMVSDIMKITGYEPARIGGTVSSTVLLIPIIIILTIVFKKIKN